MTSKWHVFYRDEDGMMMVDCTPNNGERILVYLKCFDEIGIDEWDDDMYYEHCSTGDGYDIEEGCAWMELPEPPKGE